VNLMADKNFKVKNGLEVGDHDIVTPDGTITLPSGTHTLVPSDSPTFTGTVDLTGATLNGLDALPDQSGNAGEYLTTNGTTASWIALSIEPTIHPMFIIGGV
jgi:hypothetical protein